MRHKKGADIIITRCSLFAVMATFHDKTYNKP